MNVIKSKTIGKLCHITSASLQNDITYTLHQHFPEPYGNRIPIQILQKTVCRCIDHFIYGFLIKIFRYSCRNLINTAFKGKRIIGAAVNMLQPGKNRFFMFFPQMPYKRISADSFALCTSVTSKTYRSLGLSLSPSRRAIPFAPRFTQQNIFSFHISSEAQAVASGLCAYMRI